MTGDFNEPSFLDWTRRYVDYNMSPFVVNWPTSKSIHDLGFKDSFRTFYHDEVKDPGLSWYSKVSEWEW